MEQPEHTTASDQTINGGHRPVAGTPAACGHLVVRSSIDGHPVDVHHAIPSDGSQHEPSTACGCDPVVLVAAVTEDIDACVAGAGWHGFLARHCAGR